MSAEEERLRLENLALQSKVRELEQTVANCYAVGVQLRAVIAGYERGGEPTAVQLREAARDS